MIRGVDKASIAIIISPLISLMQDQVTDFNRKGISSVCVSDKQTTSKESRRNILKGGYQLIFMSPESLFCNLDWRRMLSTDTCIYMKNLIQCNQAREQNFFISEFEPILTHKIKSIIDKSLKFGTNLLQHKLYIEFKLWDVTMIISIFMAS